MMKNRFLKELPLLLIVAIPFAYLAFVWNALPDVVPVHWDIHGQPNGWGSKYELLLIAGLLPLLTYVIFAVVPKIDPKKKIEAMGSKFYHLKFIMTLFMSVLAVFILYSAANEEAASFSVMAVLLGILFAVMGNYFQSIRPNYFIGIRTPWTLESEDVWRKTHQLGGRLWLAGGLVLILAGLFLKESISIIVMIAVTVIITIIPLVYSYIIFKNLNKPAYNNGFKE